MNPPPSDPKGERLLIRRLREELAAAAPPAAASDVPFGDDMSSLNAAGPLLWSIDTLMDGVHFRSAEHAWRAIGRKAVAVNLSDCAAMASEPVSALCSVALCDALSIDDALELLRGARELADSFGCPLVGGDTNSWPHPTVVNIAIASRVPQGRSPVLRNGARPGDRVFVSGPLGGSILGRHLSFAPRVELALRIAADLRPHAMIDVSDGLAVDLGHICEESGCGAAVEAARLDRLIHPDAVELSRQTGKPAREHALFDGEDFELIVALPPDAPPGRAEQLGLTRIGEIDRGADVRLVLADGRAETLPPRGWEHFR